MPTSNAQFSTLQVAGVGHLRTTAFFAPNGTNNPITFGGAHVTSVTRGSAGNFALILTGISPKAFMGAECYGFDNAAPTNTLVRISDVQLSPAQKRVNLTVLVSNALGNPISLKDIAANANSTVRLILHWKMFAGRDASGV